MQVLDLFLSSNPDNRPETRMVLEGGIKTAALDRAANSALAVSLPGIARTIIGHIQGDSDPDQQDSHDLFQKARYHVWQNADEAGTFVCGDLSKDLTRLVRNHLYATFGGKLPDEAVRDGFRIKDIRVVVEVREGSEDELAIHGGYYLEGRIKVFLNQTDVLAALMAVIEESITGESAIDGTQDLSRQIVPVLVHEYAHLEQTIRGHRIDRGYISGPEKGTGRRGQRRGGNQRDPSGSDRQYLRYLGSDTEIDSFASSAAAQIVQTIRRNEPDYTRAIARLRDNLAAGHGGDDVQVYADIMHRTLQGHYDKEALRYPDQVRTVWNRFKRRVWSKLGDYMPEPAGRADAIDRPSLDPKWIKAANAIPRRTFVPSLAAEVASKIELRIGTEANSRMIEQIAHNPLVDRAVSFLGAFYYGSPYEQEGDQARLKSVFIRLVQKRLADLARIDAQIAA